MSADVRPVTAEDLKVLRARWPAHDVWDSHAARAATGEASFLAAWIGEDPVGVGMVQWRGCVGAAARSAHPDAVEVNHLHVRDSHRGQGIGTGLIGHAELLASSRGVAQMVLAVEDDNAAARALYLRLGYRPTGVFDECGYAYRDDHGVERWASERSESLIKDLAPSLPPVQGVARGSAMATLVSPRTVGGIKQP